MPVAGRPHVLFAIVARAAFTAATSAISATLPWQGRRSRFDFQVRRFRCSVPECPRRIAKAVGVNRQTVQGWLRSGGLPTWQQQHHGSSVDRYADHLNRRWDEGCRNAAQLWREIQDEGFRGRLRTVQRWFRHRRDADPATADAGRTPAPWPTRCAQAHPVRSTYKMPSSTWRIGHSRGRPVCAAAGMKPATTCHSASVKLVAYGAQSRPSSARAAGVHMEGLWRTSDTLHVITQDRRRLPQPQSHQQLGSYETGTKLDFSQVA